MVAADVPMQQSWRRLQATMQQPASFASTPRVIPHPLIAAQATLLGADTSSSTTAAAAVVVVAVVAAVVASSLAVVVHHLPLLLSLLLLLLG